MFKGRWFFHPVFVFIFSIVALGFSLFLYIRTYLQANDAFVSYLEARNIEPSQFAESNTWLNVVVLSVLVAIILFCLILIFVYYQKMIRLYRMQQNFISGFTHELKTPIASLRLFLDTFTRHELSREEQIKYLAYMRRDTERLSDNVTQILDLAKIEDKKYEGDFSIYDLNELVEQWVSKSPHFFENCEITVDKHEGNSPRAKLDGRLFEMLLMNLVINGINYNQNTEKKINIKISCTEKYNRIDFTDNGMGIAKKELKNIFKKFYQIGKTSKGTGLGLYLSSHIVRIHRGQLRVDSEGPGKGSTFTVILPREV